MSEAHAKQEVPGMSRYAGQKLLVVGLGLSGTAALRFLLREGAQLVVTDSRAAPAGIDALKAEFPQVEFRLGSFNAPEPLNQFAEAVASPGVDLREPLVQALKSAGVAVIGDIELFARAANAPIVGITGSNGKSTVTTLVGEMAKAAGWRVGIGGNLAPPALEVLADDAQLYVLELSSFQLETTQSLRCKAAVILNISEDHLDRHQTMAAYTAAKARIWDGCEVCVSNADDAGVMALLSDIRHSRVIKFGVAQDADYRLVEDAKGAWLNGPGELHVHSSSLKIAGLHNAANALAAIALADAAGIPRAASLATLSAFKGLPHRCAFVAEVGGARYYNDSKGTNVGSTLAAIKGLPRPVVWLAGGQGKGQDFSPLAAALAEKGSAAILFGEDAAKIESAILGALPVYREGTMRAAVGRAHKLAGTGASVLLSPACASFDQFKSYVDRGQQFEAAVAELAA